MLLWAKHFSTYIILECFERRKLKTILLPVLLGKRWRKEKACPEEMALELALVVKFPDEGSQSNIKATILCSLKPVAKYRLLPLLYILRTLHHSILLQLNKKTSCHLEN